MADQQNRIELTQDVAQQIGGALQRLKEIGSATIISPQFEAEQKGLIQFLNRSLLTYADELIACWLAVQYEYEPLVLGFAGLMSRANGILMRKMQAAQAQNQRQEQKPAQVEDKPADNVIPLTQP